MFYYIKQRLLDSKLRYLSVVILNLIVTTKAHLYNWLLSLTCACVCACLRAGLWLLCIG